MPVDGVDIITSREAITLEQLPSSVVIVGGGSIGVEFAYLYRTYGVEVTVVELLPRLVPNEDEDISRLLERSFSRRGIKLVTGAGVTGVDSGPDGLIVKVDKDGQETALECAQVLVACGVRGNVEDLGLEAVGISTQGDCIPVDEYMQNRGGRTIRHRRRDRQAAPGPCGLGPGRPGRGTHSRVGDPAAGLCHDAQGHLLPAPGGQLRLDRGPGQGAGARGSRWGPSTSRPTARPWPWASRKASSSW